MFASSGQSFRTAFTNDLFSRPALRVAASAEQPPAALTASKTPELLHQKVQRVMITYTNHPTSPLPKTVQRIPSDKVEKPLCPDELPPDLPWHAIKKARAAIKQINFAGPSSTATLYDESQTSILALSSVLKATFNLYALSLQLSNGNIPEEGFLTPLFCSWVGGDFDRSSATRQDYSLNFFNQVLCTVATYQRMLKEDVAVMPIKGAGIPVDEDVKIGQDAQVDQPPKILCRSLGGWLCTELQNEFSKAESIAGGARFKISHGNAQALAVFFSDPEQNLETVENKINELCNLHPSHPLCHTFLHHGLSGFKGEIRINATAIDKFSDGQPSAENQLLQETFSTISKLHQIYPHTRDIVIAEFSNIKQVDDLREQLKDCELKLGIIPLLESEEAVTYFINDPAAFKEAGVKTVMLAGSDLVRACGPAYSQILRHRFNMACHEHGFNPYHGTGSALRRGGAGYSNSLADEMYPNLFYPPADGNVQENRFTLQGAEALTKLGNASLAENFLFHLKSRQSLPLDVEKRHAEITEANEIFAPLIAAELAQRDPAGEFSKFCAAYPVIGTLRNQNIFSGSRDKAKPAVPEGVLTSVIFDDRAIQAEASLTLFGLDACFTWKHVVESKANGPYQNNLYHLITKTREALKNGNEVVRDMVMNYAMQGASVYYTANCQARWKAAKFSPQHQQNLLTSLSNMRGFLQALDYDLASNTTVQKYFAEYLALSPFLCPNPAEALSAIQNQLGLVNDAAVQAIQSARALADIPAEEIKAHDIAKNSIKKGLVGAMTQGPYFKA